VSLLFALALQLEGLEAREKALREVVARAVPAYVFFGNGSGVCISPDGWALTNFHVSGARDGQKVRMPGGKVFTADVVGFDPYGDIALCKIRGAKDLPHCELGDSDALRPGTPVFAVGNPFLVGNRFWEPTVTHGIVSALHRYMDNPGYFDAVMTDAQINPGNSGGPLLTMDGKVVGINGRIDIKRFMNRVNTGIGYAIPSNQIRRYLATFKAGGRAFEGYIEGLTIGECGDARYENVGDYGDGVFIAGVIQDSPAHQAGFDTGDILFEIEGYRIWNLNRFHGVVGNWPQGSTVRAKVKRKLQAVELKVYLGEPDKVRERETAAARFDLGFTLDAFPSMTVGGVDKGGPAERAGLQPGDAVLRHGDRELLAPDELRGLFLLRKPGEELKIVVRRAGAEVEVALKIPEPKTEE
jgi:S1-C subfamily serine protease